MTSDNPIIEVNDLSIEYEMEWEDNIKAVNNVSFSVGSEDYFGLVGESGCGKSTIAKALIGGLDENGKVTSGSIFLNGDDITGYTEKELNKKVRWKEISYIPQTSMNSLDPTMRLKDHAVDLVTTHTDLDLKEGLQQFSEVMEEFGISKDRINDYPHQFSGGMQQRAMIALALFLNPSLVIADEPTTALDVLMQDQIFEFLDKATRDFGVSMFLITHDISVVFENCQEVGVMHGGQLVESASVHEVYDHPSHPYTILLKQAFPDIRYPDRELSVIQGNPPRLSGEIDYCTFADRCPWEKPKCHEGAPPLNQINDGSHGVACTRTDEIEQLKRERGL